MHSPTITWTLNPPSDRTEVQNSNQASRKDPTGSRVSPGRAGQSNPSNTTPTGTWKQGDTFGRVSLQETGTGTEPHVGEQLLCTLPLLSTPGDSRTRDTQLMSSSWDMFPDVNVIQLMGLSWDILPAVHQSSAVLSVADPAWGRTGGLGDLPSSAHLQSSAPHHH